MKLASLCYLLGLISLFACASEPSSMSSRVADEKPFYRKQTTNNPDADSIVEYGGRNVALSRFALLGEWYSENEDRKMTLYRCPSKPDFLCGRIRWVGKIRYTEDPRENSEFLRPKRKVYNPDSIELEKAKEGVQIISEFIWEGTIWVDGVIHDVLTDGQYEAIIQQHNNGKLGIKGKVNFTFIAEEFWHR